MPGRSYTGNAYRYGFNGKEKDDEVSGKGSILSFEYRIFDSRLCRWLTTDPWENKYSWQTPYAYFKNSPIAVLDYLGRGEYYGKDGNWIASDGQKDDKVFHADENGTVKFGVGILKEFMFTEWDYQVKDEKLKEFLPELIKNEGGYNDRKNDKGGKTNYGITWAAWKLHSKQLLGVQPTVSNLKHISKKQAFKIIELGFWEPSKASQISDKKIGWLYFDTYYNGGGGSVLRSTLSHFGFETKGAINSLNSLLRKYDAEDVHYLYKSERVCRYLKIIEDDPSQEEFKDGWMNRVNSFVY